MDAAPRRFKVLPEARARALYFVILIGIVSLFGDMTYEGARSITGPYLATLGASATIVGIVAGFGELAGYAIRLISGYIGDRTGRYWTVTILGYAVNLFSVPLLALTGTWESAAILIVAERIGRALRAPTRDAMLSHAASQTGAGWAFGLHEALDTTGAVIGPLAVSAALLLGQSYRTSFGILVAPALASIVMLLIARSQFPRPERLEVTQPIDRSHTLVLPVRFWIYTIAAAFIGAGYADFSLLSYHFSKTAAVGAATIPVLYAVAMIAAAVAALGLGRLFDKAGIIVLIPATVASALSAPLALLGDYWLLMVGIVCWGIGMGAQESVMRAVVGSIAPADRRGTAFGLFHTVFGVAWFIGSTLLGVIYDHSVFGVAALSFVLQILALPILIAAAIRRPGR